MAGSNAPSRLSDALTFTAIGTSEVARQAITRGSAAVAPDLKIERIHARRTSGSGTVTFTVRIYSASSDGNCFLDADLTLAATGVDAQQAVQGYDALYESGAWATIEAASGSGHEVVVTVQYTTARG